MPPGQVWPPFCTVHSVTCAPPAQLRYEAQLESPLVKVVAGMASVQLSRIAQPAKSSGTEMKPMVALPL